MDRTLERTEVREHRGNGAVKAVTERTETTVPEQEYVKGGRFWGVLRIAMGWTFLWAFLDKAFGLGFATGRNPETGAIAFFSKDAWIHGGSPTDGVVIYALHGPFKGLYDGLAGQTWVEWVYMVSMLLIGLGLLLGIGTRLAALGGIAWMAIFYTATAVWPQNNPFLDEHVVYAIILAGIAYVAAGRYLGLGRQTEKIGFVKRHPILW